MKSKFWYLLSPFPILISLFITGYFYPVRVQGKPAHVATSGGIWQLYELENKVFATKGALAPCYYKIDIIRTFKTYKGKRRYRIWRFAGGCKWGS
jgi:hypothetical protein